MNSFFYIILILTYFYRHNKYQNVSYFVENPQLIYNYFCMNISVYIKVTYSKKVTIFDKSFQVCKFCLKFLVN